MTKIPMDSFLTLLDKNNFLELLKYETLLWDMRIVYKGSLILQKQDIHNLVCMKTIFSHLLFWKQGFT